MKSITCTNSPMARFLERIELRLYRQPLLLTKTSCSVESARAWFKHFDEYVLPLFLERSPTEEQRIKVAVLDTGVQLPYPHDEATRGRLRFQSWIEGEPDMIDKEGHGTHAAGLVLRVAPNAIVCVERIKNTAEEQIEPELVAKLC